jgi:hypothetical protein
MQSETLVSPPGDDDNNDEKTRVTQNLSERSTSIGFPLGVVAILHGLGFLVLASFDWIHRAPSALTPVPFPIYLQILTYIEDHLYSMPHYSICGNCNSTHPSTQSTFTNIQLPNHIIHRQSTHQKFLPPSSGNVSLHPFNIKLLSRVFYRCPGFSIDFPSTSLKATSLQDGSDSGSDYHHAVDKSAELVLFGCQVRVWTISHGIG